MLRNWTPASVVGKLLAGNTLSSLAVWSSHPHSDYPRASHHRSRSLLLLGLYKVKAMRSGSFVPPELLFFMSFPTHQVEAFSQIGPYMDPDNQASEDDVSSQSVLVHAVPKHPIIRQRLH